MHLDFDFDFLLFSFNISLFYFYTIKIIVIVGSPSYEYERYIRSYSQILLIASTNIFLFPSDLQKSSLPE